MGVDDVERHFCLHIETNIECLLRLSQTHRLAARGPSGAQPTDRNPRRNTSSILTQLHVSDRTSCLDYQW
jgi:hypothetical protein